MADHRLVSVILEVSDIDRSVALYRDAFGLDLHPGNNAVDDRWTGGSHAEIFPGLRGATFTSPSIPPRNSRLRVYRSACPSTTSNQLTQRQVRRRCSCPSRTSKRALGSERTLCRLRRQRH